MAYFNLSRLEMDADTVAGKLTYFIRGQFPESRIQPSHEGPHEPEASVYPGQHSSGCGKQEKALSVDPSLQQRGSDLHTGTVHPKASGYMLCHEKLLDLQRMDREQNTEYMLTLRTYLEENLNATQAASLLFIHRSTFLYRLDKFRHSGLRTG